jgi:hypothetical protein
MQIDPFAPGPVELIGPVATARQKIAIVSQNQNEIQKLKDVKLYLTALRWSHPASLPGC